MTTTEKEKRHPDFKTNEELFKELGYRVHTGLKGLAVTNIRTNSRNIIFSINELGKRSIGWLQKPLNQKLGIRMDYSQRNRGTNGNSINN